MKKLPQRYQVQMIARPCDPCCKFKGHSSETLITLAHCRCRENTYETFPSLGWVSTTWVSSVEKMVGSAVAGNLPEEMDGLLRDCGMSSGLLFAAFGRLICKILRLWSQCSEFIMTRWVA
jgi:hypothetical protein